MAFSQNAAIPAKVLAKLTIDGKFQPYEFNRYAVGDDEILINILYSGICHSDIHTVKGENSEQILFGGTRKISGSMIGGIAET